MRLFTLLDASTLCRTANSCAAFLCAEHVHVLDTNVLSALMQQAPDAKLITWLDKQSRTSVWTTPVTILEIRFGLQLIAASRRRSLLLEAFETLIEKMGHRIAPFDDDAAKQAADLMASRQRKGWPVELRDTMIAGIVMARHATLATRNLVRFEDLSVPVVNPWLV